MTRTVDLVIVGGNAAAVTATIDAVRRGLLVLVVVRRRRSRLARQIRHAVTTAVPLSPQQLTVLTGAEVACVDGVKTIEAVVVRQLRTRRLIGFNVSGLVSDQTLAGSASQVSGIRPRRRRGRANVVAAR